jgi:prepilin-type N-terminal cleavage/methylation domain-containing protein
MIQNLRQKRNDGGFTLIELLVVIVILGILAAVVVFAVGGITDKGQTDACKTDTRTLRTAEEANYAKNDQYDTEANLKANGFLAQESDLHDITYTPAAAGPPAVAESYTITVADDDCGTSGHDVGADATDF